MATMRTPGVYIVEKNAFPNSVVEVATAVPAFIGYTEKAEKNAKPILNKPTRITSLAEFDLYFGAAPKARFSIDDKPTGSTIDAAFELNGKEYIINQGKGSASGRYLLYYCIRHFFQNGGGPCYIVSVGNYGAEIEQDKLTAGIDTLVREQEPTMVVIPEAVLLERDACISVQQAALMHCGDKMKNRITLLDIWGGYEDGDDCIDNFRSELGINHLDFGAAYYPWVNATIVQDADVCFENIANLDKLQDILRQKLGINAASPPTMETTPEEKGTDESGADEATKASKQESKDTKIQQQQADAINDLTKDWSGQPEYKDSVEKQILNKSLVAMSDIYKKIMQNCKEQLNLLPPSAAMAGIYTMVDNARGVWKAPANVSLNSVSSPAVNISSEAQERLNVDTQGKSINAIRTFIGEGTLVWGARTLDGNSLDWRYVNVRRTMIMLEESIRLATKAYVFENNDANTWVTIKSMVRNFLTGIWKRGGLAGTSPDDAFSIFVGLGETMTPEDILEGVLKVTVLVALIRPAEFIEITFQQQMQKS